MELYPQTKRMRWTYNVVRGRHHDTRHKNIKSWTCNVLWGGDKLGDQPRAVGGPHMDYHQVDLIHWAFQASIYSKVLSQTRTTTNADYSTASFPLCLALKEIFWWTRMKRLQWVESSNMYKTDETLVSQSWCCDNFDQQPIAAGAIRSDNFDKNITGYQRDL